MTTIHDNDDLIRYETIVIDARSARLKTSNISHPQDPHPAKIVSPDPEIPVRFNIFKVSPFLACPVRD